MKIYTKIEEIERFVEKTLADEAKAVEEVYPFRCTDYYFFLAKSKDFSDAVFRQFFPEKSELSSCGEEDPFGEDESTGIPHLVRRYKNRLLVVTTNLCFVYCRFCMRKRNWKASPFVFDRFDELENYLKAHPEISDVILSGGDPFALPVELLEELLARIRSVESVRIVRIGTRAPVVAPDIFDGKRLSLLEKYAPLWINTHFNHPNEVTRESRDAILSLLKTGVSINNQSVLLKGVNDSFETLKELFFRLASVGVRPYYLFSCDPVKGTQHFKVDEGRGVELTKRLLSEFGPMVTPRFAVDTRYGKRLLV